MTGPERILYVEDDADIRAIAEIALVDVGAFSVQMCSSGEEALNSMADYRPDLILLDVMMPGMDGPETLKALRATPTGAVVPVIFITAKIQSSEVQEYKDLGAVDVITKPFDPMELPSQIRGIWASLPSKSHQL